MLFRKQILHGIPLVEVVLMQARREYLSPTLSKAPHRMVRLPNRKSAQTRFLCSLLWNHKREGWKMEKCERGSHVNTRHITRLVTTRSHIGLIELESPGASA